MKRLNLKDVASVKTFPYGIPLTEKQEAFVNRAIEELAGKAPSNAALNLNFENRKGCVKGSLEISNLHKSFSSNKAAVDPIQTLLLLIDDIETKLLEWKRERFSDALISNIDGPIPPLRKNETVA